MLFLVSFITMSALQKKGKTSILRNRKSRTMATITLKLDYDDLVADAVVVSFILLQNLTHFYIEGSVRKKSISKHDEAQRFR